MRRDLFFGPLQDRISRCFILLAMLLSIGIWGQYSYTTLGSTYTQDFNNLSSTAAPSGAIAGGSLNNVNATLNGWYFLETGSSANTTYTATNGSSASGETFSLGTVSNSDRALGGLQSGSVIPTIGFYFTNNTGSTITSLEIAYTGEQWRLGATGRNDKLDFQYSTDATSLSTGAWTDVDLLDFTAPISTGTAGALDGNLTANKILITNTITGLSITNGSKVFIRWNDFNATGADDALGIDAFSIKGTISSITPTITTTSVSGITTTTASSGGNVTADGGASVTARGVYYGTSTAPTTGTSDGSGIGSFISSLSSLSVNTRYFYRAYATNSAGTSYGVESSFFTLANTPSAPTVATPATTSLNVSVTSGDGNPTTTEYAIHETTTNQFVQANGSLGATVAWQTSATWGTKTVTGLTPSTSYTFETKARNGANVETAYSSTASGTTLANEILDYWNLQSPVNQTISQGSTFEVYAQAYKLGLTEAAGASAGLSAWIGYSSSNTNPNTAGWTWIPATFNVQAGNNDEFKATLGAGLLPGTYYYASRFQLNTSTYSYGGVGGDWNNNSGILTVNSNKVNWANIQSPVSGTIVIGNNYTVYSQVNKPGITGDANSHSGITAWIGYSSTNDNPSGSGWTWVSATRNTGFSNTSNDEYSAEIGSGRLAGTYYYASRYQVTGSTEYFYGGHSGGPDTGGEWGNPSTNVSGILTVKTPQDINIKQGTNDILTNGTYAFGSQVSGSTGAAVVFTIQNTGQTNLDLTGAPKIVKSGTNAAEFAVDETTTTSPVTGNSSTTFTVTFSPTSLGAKAAQLSIANNDAIGNENPYIINLTGTGTASVVSDITIKTGYTYPQNIAYTNYQATDVTGGANDIEIAKFTIRDGGATADADNLATTLTQLSFNLTNGGNVRRVAIYDGATEVAEQAGSTTHTFSGLNLTAPDGGTKDFSIRVSFKSSVTDNQQLSIGITSTTTAAATGSTFASASAGAASTSTATDNNRIEVTADRFAFVAQPTNTNLGVAMTPNVTVSANDIFGNRDLDYAGAIEITSSGTLNTTPKSATATNGLASFNTIVHTATGTGLLLTAGLTGYISGNSNAFNIVLTSATTDYFRSKQTGNWATAATWESSPDGINWLSPSTLAPTSAATSIEILNTHTITTATNAAAKNLIVRSGGILHINFALTNNGNFEVEDNGTVNFNNGSYSASGLSTTLWNGTEIFHPNSNFVIQNQASSASDFFIPANTDISANAYNGFTACFGNLIFDSSGSATYSVFGGAFTKNLTHGNLIFRSATVSSNAVRLTSSSLTTVIGGNLIMESGFNRNVNVTTAGITGSITINGDFINESAKSLTMVNNASGNLTLNVNGNIKVNTTNTNAGILNLSSAGSGTVNLKGDLTSGPSSSLVATTGTTATFNFIGTGDGSTDATTQTISLANQATVPYIIFNVNNGAYAKLKDYNLSLGTNSAFTVKNGGTLDFGFNGNTVLNLIANGAGQAFSAASGSTLKITSPLGITSYGDNTGNVQIGATVASNRVFNAGATYHYIGKANQVSGNGLPAVTGKVIVEMASNLLGFQASDNTRTIASGGTLEIRQGIVTDDTTHGFNGAGNLTMNSDNGRYIVNQTGTQPSLTGTYTLTAGTVEFGNTSSTEYIRSTPTYYNVDVSGTDIISGGKDFVVNNLLKVTTATAVLTTPEEIDTANPYVVTAKKGIQVAAGGKAIFKNNANLIQDVGAANNGNIVAQRIAKIKFVSVAAQADYNYWSSPVADQKLLYNAATLGTSFSPGTPNNRIFQYKESSDTFVATTDPNFIAGKGYAVRAENAQNGSTYTADGNPKIFEFMGTPNNGDISTPVLSWKDAAHGYNLVGNPYPSIIDFNLLQTANSDLISKTAYFWTNVVYTPSQQGSSATGYTGNNYATFNGTGGTPAGGSLVEPTKYIKTGQGFIVQTKKAGALQFTNAIRAIGISPFFNNKLDEEKNRFWLTLSTPSNMTNTILVGYIEGATNAFEKDYDAPMLTDGSDSFYSILGNQKLIIQGKEDSFTDSDIIPLGTKYYETGTHKIQLYKKEGIFNGGQNVYLKDKLLNKTVNLTSGDYTFTAVKGTDATRFEIIYKDDVVLGTDTATKSDFTVYKDGSDYVIKSSKILGKVEVYDTAGRMVVSKKTTENNIRLNAATLTNGVYIIKAENSGDVRTKKVIK